MHSQTSLVATQVRLQQWAEQVKDCQNRPHDMSVDQWCQLHDITKANYYYRLRRVREVYLSSLEEQIPMPFIELPAPSPEELPKSAPSLEVAGVIHGSNGIRIELCNGASIGFMKTLLEVLSHA